MKISTKSGNTNIFDVYPLFSADFRLKFSILNLKKLLVNRRGKESPIKVKKKSGKILSNLYKRVENCCL